MTSPGFTFTEAFATVPFTRTRPASHASLATVLLLINLETFKNLSHLILFPSCNKELPQFSQQFLSSISYWIVYLNYAFTASFNALPALNFGALHAAIIIVSFV